MTEQPDSPKPFQIERRGESMGWNGEPAPQGFWLEVGAISMDGEFPSARDALTTWAGEQTPEPPLGRYRVIDRHGYLTEFDVSEHRERVIERVERQAAFSDERARRSQETADVILDLAETPLTAPEVAS